MEKSRKLRRYSRKDYTQLVDFPVEIVGRDGIVRRYSFEESIRLYQRRIASASARYDDVEVVAAEIRHCRRRIDQLRRSYFARYGWATIRGTDGTHLLNSELAGEVAAFLRRCLDRTSVELGQLDCVFLDEGKGYQVYYVHRTEPLGDADERYLLYVYRFEDDGPCPGREAFFSFLKVLQDNRGGAEGMEVLVAFHHTADCGLILSGRMGEVRIESPEPDDSSLPSIDLTAFESPGRPDPLREAMMLLHQGARSAALKRFRAAYEQNHYRRAAYVGAAVVADQLGETDEALTATRMAVHYFPHDPALQFHLAVAALRKHEVELARQAIARSRELGGDSPAHRLLDALIMLDRGRLHRGATAVARLLREPGRLDPDVLRAARWVGRQLLARRLLVLLAFVVSGGGGALYPVIGTWSLPVIGLGFMLAAGAHLAWRRRYGNLLAAPGIIGLRLGHLANLQDPRVAPVRNQQ